MLQSGVQGYRPNRFCFLDSIPTRLCEEGNRGLCVCYLRSLSSYRAFSTPTSSSHLLRVCAFANSTAYPILRTDHRVRAFANSTERSRYTSNPVFMDKTRDECVRCAPPSVIGVCSLLHGSQQRGRCIRQLRQAFSTPKADYRSRYRPSVRDTSSVDRVKHAPCCDTAIMPPTPTGRRDHPTADELANRERRTNSRDRPPKTVRQAFALRLPFCDPRPTEITARPLIEP